MSEVRSEFLKTVKERGYFHQTTDLEALDALAVDGRLSGYIGFDATATSLHAGSLVQNYASAMDAIMRAMSIVLMGGGTSKVGDPSGKDEQRRLLTDADISHNIQGIKGIFAKFLTFGDGNSDAIMVNNADWLDKLQYIDFLRDYGRHFSVNRMLTFDSVKLRLDREQPLSFLEFNYMILQSYDFLELFRRYHCQLQMGGSDQWGNIVSGVELGRRVDGAQLFGLLPRHFWQPPAAPKWGRRPPAPFGSTKTCFRLMTIGNIGGILRMPMLAVSCACLPNCRLMKSPGSSALKVQRSTRAKIVLSNEATAMCHGPAAAKAAAETARQTFQEGGAGDDLPRIDVTRTRLSAGVPLYELLRETGLAKATVRLAVLSREAAVA